MPEIHIMTIMCCHEAAHAIAAYRLRFPYHYVRVTLPVNGIVTETDLGPDTQAMDIAKQYLEAAGIDTRDYWAGYLSVLAIAKFVNQHHNALPENVAAGFAANDFQVFNQRLATFSAEFQTSVVDRVNEFINDIWGHPRFTEALEAVANALLNQRYLVPSQVTEAIEGRVGAAMRPNGPEPAETLVRECAYLRYTRRVQAEQVGTAENDWYESERGLRYVLAGQP